MKKTLIALAVLGSFAGAAAAQSSATLYGKLDVGYGVGNGGTYEGLKGRDSKFQQWGNSRTTSRWGLKGEEDLGNGLTVYFNLESKIDPENGSTGSKLFDRAAIVGIKGSFGAIQAGRQTTVVNNVLGQFDLSGSPNLTSALGNAGLSAISQRFGGSTYARVDSALAYISPNFSGFSFQAAVVLKNDLINGPDSKTLYTIGAQYTIGGFKIGAAFESKPVDMAGVSSSWGIGAKYDFGSFVISGGYFDNHLKADGRGFYLGAMAPIGAFEVGAQVAYNTRASNGTKTNWTWIPDFNTGTMVLVPYQADDRIKPLAWELFANYKLSNRTSLYAQYGGLNGKAETFQGADRKYSASFGIIHNF